MTGVPETSSEKEDKQKSPPFDAVKRKMDEWKVDVKSFFSNLTTWNNKDVKYFRRLICCKLKDASRLELVIQELKKTGFKDITDVEPLGRRRSRIMLEYGLEDKIHRLHLRVHTIDKTSYFLIHKELIPSPAVNNLFFHVRGFFDRMARQMNNYIASKKNSPDTITINYDERSEMADYERGCYLFRELIKEKNPALFNMLDFYLDEQDFLTFSIKFGNVSKILPVELLINDFTKNFENANILGLSDNIRTIFEELGFKNIKVLPLKEKLEFIKANPGLSVEMESTIDIYSYHDVAANFKFFGFFTKNMLGLETLAKFIEFEKISIQVYILVIINAGAFNLDVLKAIKKLRKKDINASYINLLEFKVLFEKFLNSPFSLEKLLKLVESRDIITHDCIDELMKQRNDGQQLSRLILEILDYLGKNPGWQNFKDLKRALLAKNAGTSEENLDHVFDFLRNPLLELVQTRKNGKDICGIENKEELKLKLNNMKKILNSIDGF